MDRLSDELQQEADAPLAESGLIQLLEKHGNVTIGGSYKYQLMTVSDIDLYVTGTDAGRDQGKRIVCELIDQGFWRGYALEDFVQFPREDFPTGIYIGLKRSFRERFWKVDIWNLPEIPKDVLCLDEAMSQLSDARRIAIMKIKRWRDSNSLKIPSKSIYDAVLLGRACDVESFKRFEACDGFLSPER
ncbi:MAG TPA: hypothetical protein VHS06_03810 [Chloroflexota bacterium]|nr:hypothetical protein [Chloroflexota bacterium]